ncbi:MAG TPA: DNA double-strand break repair nuclease NurA [Dehalococcoidales bacterium]
MSLDLSQVVKQITEMVARLKTRRKERLERITRAVDILHSQADKLDSLKKKIALSKTTWLVAEPVEVLDKCMPAPDVPTDFTVIATDGSHIDVDRHHAANCFLINIGVVVLRYGANPDAFLDSQPVVYSSDADLMIASPDGLREVPVEGNLLGVKRSVEECRRLAELVRKLPSNSTVLGLMDGSLILWNLEAYPEFVTESLLNKGYLTYLDEIHRLTKDKQIVVASYISFPRSTDVVNALRVAMCPRELVDSDRCSDCTTRECYSISGVHDRDLFAGILKPGERSVLFISPSKIQKRYGKHLVYFFYLRLNGEIARVEVPRWVAEDRVKLGLVHTLVLDQCRRGQGYPVALSEAHEKAVVTGADRDNFWRMVDESLVEKHLPVTESEKSRSKRTRWL